MPLAKRIPLAIICLTILIAATRFADNKLPQFLGTETAIVLPDDYYQLSNEVWASIFCAEPSSGSLLVGTADIYRYPTLGVPTDYVLVTSRAIDLETESLEFLEPFALFHLRHLDNNRIYMGVYTRKNSTWSDTLKFWQPRFSKEWGMSEEQTYSTDDNGNEIGNAMLKKIYGMDCRLTN